ncbi:MAG: SUMF1/EgtB/PvdO family nonheme iron enzyme, partial [Chitinivibrionales bacterium]|nr:SUMF1/EgtB/PvdO family nonheme iron enzyme [Chitinivibrionales bacterium]
DDLVRINKHTPEQFADPVARYAKPPFCTLDMVLVDSPPTKADRPYFKVCIDRYEYPNIKDSLPLANISYAEAAKICAGKGKRLCSAFEWQWACSGVEGYAYPYGWNFEKETCNTQSPEPSGRRGRCASKFGAFDMTGNIWEWVSDADNGAVAMGGPASKCQTRSPGFGDAKPTIGFRCCKGN